MTFIDLLNAYHIMPQFSPAVLLQTEKMPKEVEKCDLEGRMDLTEKQIFTIDGDDAKDFDDAVSIELLDNNNYLLGVHIADVSHYVTEGSAIDRSAYTRGTSVYLIDTVIPMLPFELSNGLCSLRAHEIRLTISVFMEISPRGKVERYQICESYIKSCERMTYNNVTKILDGDEKLCTKYAHLVSCLHNMKRLARILKKKRFSEGSIDFVTHESKITLDSSGKPTSVERYPITESNGIIEEFMLVCNKTIANHLSQKGIPCVYRIHEQPDLMRIERLSKVLPVLGVDFEYSTAMKPKDFQKILKLAENLDCADVVNYLVLRTMSKAKYNEKNLGHFGLAFSSYCHFTSPIRRYPDLVVHRVLKKSLSGDINEAEKEKLKEFVIGASISSSTTEINAADAEIAWKNVKKAEYMADKIGEEDIGVITHVTSSGFFVELENTVEGFVPARTIEDDIYVISENGLSLVGMRNKAQFTVGERVKIRVAAVDLEQSRVDFELVGQKINKIYSRKTKKVSKRKADDKKALHRIKEENAENRREKKELYFKADFERNIFENALIFELLNEMRGFKKMRGNEKRFLEITVSDTAAMIIMPLYKSHLNSSGINNLKECSIAAVKSIRFMLQTLEESFDVVLDEGYKNFAVEYVKSALRHFDACMRTSETNRAKREHEYDSIARKKKQKMREVKK